MAKQDNKADLSALKQQETRTEQLIKKHESILDLYVKQGKSAEDINKKAKTLENAYLRIAKIQGKVLNLEEGITKEDGAQEKSLIKQLTSAGSILAITEKMKSAITFIGKTQRDTANTMAVTLNKAQKINKAIAKELKDGLVVDTTRAQILDTMNEMDNVLRSSTMYTEKQATALSITANKLNISRSEAAKLTGLMQTVDGASAESAKATLVLAKNLADANDVKFGKAMKDIASSGQAFANFSGQGMKNMIRTAIETRKMGFELNDAMNIANKLLDIEGSIESQMKFNVITGKNANFDKARALVLEGKHAEALKEVTSQVGDINNLGVIGNKVLNEAVGMDVTKLQTAQAIAAVGNDNVALQEAANEALATGNESLATALQAKLDATTADEANENAQKNIQESLAAQVQNQKVMKGILMSIQIVQGTIAAIASVKAIAELTSMSALTVGIGMLATLAAVGTGVAYMNRASSSAKSSNMKDGVIGSDGGMVVSGPKGSIQLDKDDSIIAGTNLGGSGGGSGMGEKLDKIIYLLSQQRVLNVSGTQLSEVMALERIPIGMG
jgi:hypothetical protein